MDKPFKAIFAMLQVGILVIAVYSWAFAQESGISGFPKNLSGSRNVLGRINTVKDVSPHAVTETGPADPSDYYSFSIPSPGNYTLLAAKPGYFHRTLPGGGIDLSAMTPNRPVAISLAGKTWLQEKPVQVTKVLSWETGAGKSYFIPAMEIPAFLFFLNMYDRFAYPNEVADGKKTYDTNLSTFWDHLVPRALGGRS